MRGKGGFAEFDWWLVAMALALCGLGLIEIFSATRHTTLAGLALRQLEWIGLGLVAMAVLSRIDYQAILNQAPLLYLITLCSLVAVLVLGHSHFGARRWVAIAGVPFQVSELAKLAIIIVVARFLSEARTEQLTGADLFKISGLVAVPLLLILLQPDMGSALTLVPVALVGVFLAGIRWKHFLVLVILGVLLLPVGWQFALKPYQKARITAFLEPEADPRGSGYQILQSEIAVGSGGLWGKGIGKGSQNQLGFVPVRYSDFILAALAEELGFAGVVLALGLYVGVLLRLIADAQQAKDKAGMYLVMGVVAILAFHVLVNAAMVIGYTPITGIPLPLVSYGGSATLFVFMSLGLVMSVRTRRFVN